MEFVVIASLWLGTLFLGALSGFAMAMLSTDDERRYTAQRLREAVERCKRGDDA